MKIDHGEVTCKNRNLKAESFDVIKAFENYDSDVIQIRVKIFFII
ncbi:hypothetical protein [Clostridium moutaii]